MHGTVTSRVQCSRWLADSQNPHFPVFSRPPACRSGVLDHHPGGQNTPFLGFWTLQGGKKYPIWGGFGTPFGTPFGHPRRGALTETANLAIRGLEGLKIGAIDQDFGPENPEILAGCHPRMAISGPDLRNWWPGWGFGLRKISVLAPVSP